MTDYPALELLVNNYLDQSWDLHYLSAWDAVLDFSVREEVSLQLAIKPCYAAFLIAG